MNKEPRFRKYPRIPHLAETLDILNHDVEVFEKLDGGNTQVRLDKGKLFCGSRANYLTRPERFKQRWFHDFQKWTYSNHTLYNLPENLIVYGEFLAPHTLEYNSDWVNQFFVLDVLDTNKKRFLGYEDAKRDLTERGIEGVNFLEPLRTGDVDYEELCKLVLDSKSKYRAGPMEGVVVKDYSRQKFAKLWRTTIENGGEICDEDISRIARGLLNNRGVLSLSQLVNCVRDDLRRSGSHTLPEKIEAAVSRYFRESIPEESKVDNA